MMRIAADYLYTLSHSYEPLRKAYVEYDEDGCILDAGPCPFPEKEQNYVHGAIVPGFVNTHCHLELSHMLGAFARGTGMSDFVVQITSIRNNKTHEEILSCIQQWLDYMWLSGVSALADISNCADTFRIKAASPVYTRTFIEVLGTEPEDCDRIMDSAFVLQKQAEALGLDAAPTPHAYYTMSKELLLASCGAGLESGFLSYHSEESPQEQQMCIDGCGPLYESRLSQGLTMPPISGKPTLAHFIDQLETLHPAPFTEHILLVHEVCMDEDGMDKVACELPNAFIALCPRSNIYIHNALPPVPLMRSKGMKITLGTDSLSSNDSLDMVSELLCLQENFPEIPLGEMLGWACLNGACFLGKESEFGSIEAGKKPGIVTISHLSPDGRLTTASRSRRIV